MDTEKRFHPGLGRRKRSVATARYTNTGKEINIVINNKKYTEYFPKYQQLTIDNFLKSMEVDSGDFSIMVKGGGLTGQVEAIRLAMSKAILKFNPETKVLLRSFGFFTTDNRKVLPKRPGLKKARKKEQWAKR